MTDDYDDELDDVIGAAIGETEESGGELDDLGAQIAAGGDIDDKQRDDEPGPEPQLTSTGGGGDIDDDPFGLQSETKKREAVTIQTQWRDEFNRREEALKQAQEKWRAAKKKTRDSDEFDDEEDAAASAVIEQRIQVEEARKALGQAEQYTHYVETASQMPAAQREWMALNPKVASDPRLLSQAKSLYRSLEGEGFNPAHPAFYREMDKRMKQTPRMGGNSARRTTGVAPAVHTQNRGKAGKEMSDTEKAFVSRLGYNPKDEKVSAQWRDSKRNTARIAKARGFL